MTKYMTGEIMEKIQVFLDLLKDETGFEGKVLVYENSARLHAVVLNLGDKSFTAHQLIEIMKKELTR